MLAITVGIFLFLWGTPPAIETSPSLTAALDPIQSAIQSGDLAEAQQLLETAVQQNPENAANHYQLGLVLAVLTPDNAQRHLTQAAALDASYTSRSNTLQNALLRASLEEDVAYQMILIGQALGALEEWALAKAAFEISVILNEEYAEAWAYLGEAQQHTGEDGLEALHTAIKLDPESLAINLFLGIYWRRNQRPDLALPYFEYADQLAPNTPTIQVEIGQTLVNAGEVQDAIRYYQEAVALSSDKKDAWQTFAAYAIDNELYTREIGLPATREALLLDPSDPYSLTLMGRAYALLGEDKLAIRFYEKAIVAAPEYIAAYYYLGLIQLASGDQEAAQSNFILAAEKDPGGNIGKMAEEVLATYFP